MTTTKADRRWCTSCPAFGSPASSGDTGDPWGAAGCITVPSGAGKVEVQAKTCYRLPESRACDFPCPSDILTSLLGAPLAPRVGRAQAIGLSCRIRFDGGSLRCSDQLGEH